VTSDEATLAVIDALEAEGVPYMLVGSLASNLYGVPRATHDADFVVQLRDVPITRVSGRLPKALRLEPQMSFESVTGTSKFVLTLADPPFTIEVFLLSDDPHDRERFERRRRVRTMGREPFVASPEDVIIMKLRWSVRARRRKDIDDVQNVIAVYGGEIDWDYVHTWCERHGSRAVLDEVRASLPAS
jgi:hypothetical protein